MSKLTRKIAAATVAGTVGLAALTVGAASPAGAMPKDEFKFLCKLSGGSYWAAGDGVCFYKNGPVIYNDINEP